MTDKSSVCTCCDGCGATHEAGGWKHLLPEGKTAIIWAAILWAAAWLFPKGGIELGFFIAAYLVCGWEVLYKSVKNLLHGEFLDENFLMSLATLGAFVLGEYPEAVGVMCFYQIGEFFMEQALHRSRRSVRALMDLTPQQVHLKQEGVWKEVSPKQVETGAIILVKPGERVALDGKVLQGESLLDTSALTGETVPRRIAPGQEVFAGVIVLDGALELQVLRPFTDSAVSKILELVEHSYSKKTRSERFITRFARWYTPLVVLAALLTAVLPPVLFEGQTLHIWGYRALIFLVISCPCALVLSVPLGFFGGIGAAAKRGILIKGSGSLEGLAKGEIIVFDKTGTLTQGAFCVTQIITQPGFEQAQLLAWAAAVESHSTHPIARAICQAYGKTLENFSVTQRKEQAGQGVTAVIDGQEIFVGKNIGAWPEATQVSGTQIFITVNKQFAGSILLTDQLKAQAKQSVLALKTLGFKRTVMLTGDQAMLAQEVAQQTGIDVFYAGLLPTDKVQRVEELLLSKTQGRTLLAVGDGINDAPLLARADVGIAMGALGSDAAVEAADVVLVDDNLVKIPLGVKLGRFTLRVVKQNIIFALAVKLLVMLLGVLGDATLWQAVFADVGVALLCVLNSLRPLAYKE